MALRPSPPRNCSCLVLPALIHTPEPDMGQGWAYRCSVPYYRCPRVRTWSRTRPAPRRIPPASIWVEPAPAVLLAVGITGIPVRAVRWPLPLCEVGTGIAPHDFKPLVVLMNSAADMVRVPRIELDAFEILGTSRGKRPGKHAHYLVDGATGPAGWRQKLSLPQAAAGVAAAHLVRIVAVMERIGARRVPAPPRWRVCVDEREPAQLVRQRGLAIVHCAEVVRPRRAAVVDLHSPCSGDEAGALMAKYARLGTWTSLFA